MSSFDFYFGFLLGELLLNHSDNLSTTLQATQISDIDGQKLAEMTVCTLQSMRSDDNFKHFWAKVTNMAIDLDREEPRKRKRPR